MKLINAINHYFIHDEDEKGTVSDYAWFYGFYSVVFITAIMTVVKLFMIGG